MRLKIENRLILDIEFLWLKDFKSRLRTLSLRGTNRSFVKQSVEMIKGCTL